MRLSKINVIALTATGMPKEDESNSNPDSSPDSSESTSTGDSAGGSSSSSDTEDCNSDPTEGGSEARPPAATTTPASA